MAGQGHPSEKTHRGRQRSDLFILSFFGFVYLVGLIVINQLIALINNSGKYLEAANDFINGLLQRVEQLYQRLPAEFNAPDFQVSLDNTAQSFMGELKSVLQGALSFSFDVAKVLPGFIIMTVVFFVAFFLFCMQLPNMKEKFLSIFDPASHDKVDSILRNLKDATIGFIQAQLILSSLTYVISLIGLWILRIDYAFAIALIIVIVDILPILGTGATLVPWAVYLYYAGEPFTATGLLILYLVLTVFRRSIEPKILGESMGIGTLSTLISMYIGFELLGVVGLFLGPILIIIFQAFRRVGVLDLKIKF